MAARAATASLVGEGLADRRSQVYLLAGLAGFGAGVVIWVFASHGIAASIAWVEDNRPELVGSRRLRIAEVTVCGALFLTSAALAFWIARLLWLQIK